MIDIIVIGQLNTTSEEKNNMKYVTLDLCPLYDNGSSLCSYEDDTNVEIFLKIK